MRQKTSPQWVKGILGTALLILASGFIIATLSRNFDVAEGVKLAPDAYTVIAVLAFASAVLISALLWRSILNCISERATLGRMDSFEIYSTAWLLKYLPGKAWSYIYRTSVARQKGFQWPPLISSFVYETLFLVLASTVPALLVVITLALIEPGISLYPLLPLFLAAPMLILLYPPIVAKLTKVLSRASRRLEPSILLRLRPGFLARTQAAFLLPRILNGLAFVLIAHSVLGVTPDMIVPLIAFYMLAGILGSLAFFAPSGIGVREGVLIALSIHYYNMEQAMLLAAITRVYTVAADAILAGILLTLRARRWIPQ